MKHIWILGVLFAACATETQDLGPNTVEVAGANSEALLASCSDNTYATAQKQLWNSYTHTTWSWGGPLTGHWNGTAPGGRTGTSDTAGYGNRYFNQSQGGSGTVWCTCPSTGNASCHF